MGLEKVGVKVDEHGAVIVDEYQTTSVPNIFAIGDVAGKALLTPVAIAAGRRLSNRLFGGPKYKDDKISYENIPTVVFACVLSLVFQRMLDTYGQPPLVQASYNWNGRADGT
jgi:glutathione reductase (NADPH)